MAVARTLACIFYAILAGVLLLTLWRLIFAGKVEVIRSGFKVDLVEAPSVAICPFYPDSNITRKHGPAWAQGTRVWETTLAEEKGHASGLRRELEVKPYLCRYDRGCVCVDLFKTVNDTLVRTLLRDYEGKISDRAGFYGAESERVSKFKDSVELRTDLTDPSDDYTLKIGFYDSRDSMPQWFYVNQGELLIASLELQTWTVTDVSLRGFQGTAKGDLEALMKRRHIFRIMTQEVGRPGALGRSIDETSIQYSMHTFFVDDTLSSETAFSFYTLIFLVIVVLFAGRMRDLFFDVFLPLRRHEDVKVDEDRKLSPYSERFGRLICCWLPMDDEESTPLAN